MKMNFLHQSGLVTQMTDGQAWDRFTSHANFIVERESVFEMRRRMNHHHPQDVKDQEKEMFDNQQRQEWATLKYFFCNFRDQIERKYRESDNKKHRNLFESVSKVIEDEMSEEVERMLDE